MFWARPGRQTLIWEIYFLFFLFLLFLLGQLKMLVHWAFNAFIFWNKIWQFKLLVMFWNTEKKNTSKTTCVWFKMNFFSWYSNIDNQWTWLCNLTQCTSKMCLFITHLYCFHFDIVILFYLYFLLDNFDWYRKEQYIWKLAFNQGPFF